MAATSEFKELGFLNSCMTGAPVELEIHTALASESEHATTSASSFVSAGSKNAIDEKAEGGVCITSIEKQEPNSKKSFRCFDFFQFCLGRKGTTTESGKCTTTSEQVEQMKRSMVHWSQLSEAAFNPDDGGAAEMDNREVFQTLQLHPIWGLFYRTFGYDTEEWQSAGSLEVGSKCAEGGQAELFHAKVTWANPTGNADDREEGREWVLKVFRKGTLLRHLQSQCPEGFLQWWAEYLERSMLGKPATTRYTCAVAYGTLLKDGRFASLMVKEQEDLRSVIDRNMQTNRGNNHGPFQKDKEEAELIMFRIALGMDWLHSRNIIHRDLKASNVLVDRSEISGDWACFVADFECSIGVVGTGFWKAPEILQAIKDMKVLQRLEVFSKGADVYAYGMTCYEILTGKLPFESHSWKDYDLVLNGNRPDVPEYVDDWAQELLNKCWHHNPIDRPSFGDIINILEASSRRVGRYVNRLKQTTNVV